MKVPNLLLVDDVAIIADSIEDMNCMLDTVEDFRKRNRLSLSAKKTKIMIVNVLHTVMKYKWRTYKF